MSGTTTAPQAPETPHGAHTGPTGGLGALRGLLSLPARAARYEALTAAERALLRAGGALWQTGLAAALAAVGDAAAQQFMAGGGSVAALSWPALGQVAQVAFLTAVITGAVKLVSASSDPLIAQAGEAVAPQAPALGARLAGALVDAEQRLGHGLPATPVAVAAGGSSGSSGAGDDPAATTLAPATPVEHDALHPVDEYVAEPMAWGREQDEMRAAEAMADTQPALPVITLDATTLPPAPAAPQPPTTADEYQASLKAEDGPPTIVSAKVVVAQVTPPAPPPPPAAPPTIVPVVAEPETLADVALPAEEPSAEAEEPGPEDLAALEARVAQARAQLAEALRRAHPGMSAADHKAESWAR